jgi:hypothetical protein
MSGLVICRSVAALLVAVLLPTPSPAQTVDEIVARHIAARGGYERLQAIRTIKFTRTIATPFSTITVVVYKKRPQLFRVEQTAPGGPMVPRGIDAQSVWDVQQGKVVTRGEAAAAEAREFDADFDGLLVDWKAKGHAVTFEGREKLPGGDALKLKVTTKSGAVRTIYLDAATFLDRRHVGVLNLPGGRRFDVVTDFSNWREVDGVKFPFDLEEERTGREPVQSFVTYTQKIEVNVPMDDSLFAPPAGGGADAGQRAKVPECQRASVPTCQGARVPRVPACKGAKC